MQFAEGQCIRLPGEGDYREVAGAIPSEGGSWTLFVRSPAGLWIVSLELAAVNQAVYEAIHPDRAGFDTVVFDEAAQ